MIDCDPSSPCNQVKELTDAEKQKFERQARARRRAQARAKGRAKRKVLPKSGTPLSGKEKKEGWELIQPATEKEPRNESFKGKTRSQRIRLLWARQNELSRMDG